MRRTCSSLPCIAPNGPTLSGSINFAEPFLWRVAQQAYAKFVSDESAGLWRAVPMPENAFELCADLAHRYASKLGIRTLDTLHVACAMELKAERFWTFDERQAKLAKAQGMKAA